MLGLIYSPDEVILKRNLVANLALHVNILGLNLALMIDFWHDHLPSDSMLDLPRNGPYWQQSLKFDSKCQSNEWILNVLLQLDSARSMANSLSIRLI